MKIEMQYHYDNTEWLYAPGFVYHQYDDGVTRELNLIFPCRAAWESDERFPLVVYIPGAAWHKQELCNDVPKYTWGKRPTTCLMGADSDEECLEMADIAVCRNYVTDDVMLPPVLLLHFADDPIVNSQMIRDLYEILTQTGHRAVYYELTGYAHGGNGMWANEIVNIMHHFILQNKNPAFPEVLGDKIFDISPRERILLSAIRRRPGMYVGEYSLSRLRNFFDGYRSALREHHLDQCCCIIPGGIAFHNFVTKRYGLYPDSIGYDHAILNNIPDGKEAIETFF